MSTLQVFLLLIWAKAEWPFAASMLNLPANELAIYGTLDQAGKGFCGGVSLVVHGAGWRENTGFRPNVLL